MADPGDRALQPLRGDGYLDKPVVLAFGGNALLPNALSPDAQAERADAFARAIGALLPERAGMALVHGNGPQVGRILLRIEATKDKIPPETLDILVAETQGSIGYLLSKALRNRIPQREIAAILTQVRVEPGDPGFETPSKPVGPFYTDQAAAELQREQGWRMAKVPGKGWRRLVPSPRPQEIVEMNIIRGAVGCGQVVIAGGGGGIPVVKRDRLAGVEAVIDKDLTAGLLAVSLNAQKFVLLTDVMAIFEGFGTPRQRRISSISARGASELMERGEFPAGSMGPKVEAAVSYVRKTGHPAIITDLDHLAGALEGRGGTWIHP
jgi:carbamate kinase